MNLVGQIQATVNPFSKYFSVQIKDFSSQVLGGTVQSQELVFHSARPQHTLKLHLDGIKVEELLKLEQQEHLQGTGVLDGVIPLTIGSAGIEVHQGYVEARPPGGVIRYHSADDTMESLSQVGAQLKLVTNVLENFQYEVLRSEVDYDRDGTLNLRMRLEGRNPDLQQSRPIHLNVNLEENIPSLLKSLAVVRGIEKDIEHMLKSPPGKSTGN